MKFDSYLFTTAGGRDENQDSAGILEKENTAIYVVADGLGGHALGKEASEAAVDTLIKLWSEAEGEEKEDLWLSDQIGKANESILALQQETGKNMKSTVVALDIEGNRAYWANTGDSRLYFVRGGKLIHATEDHSVAYKKYQAGEITKSEIATDEDQSSLLKALGNKDRWQPDAYRYDDLQPGDMFLLCCDGFWEYVQDEEIVFDSLKASSAQEWAALLLLRAMARIKPGNDNLTVITLMLHE